MKPRNFKRIWGKPWDWYYLLDLERHKIREMMNYINKTQRFVGWEIVVRDMRTCIKLIDIVLEEDIPYKTWLHQNYSYPFKDFEHFKETPFPRYVNVKNADRFLKPKNYLIDPNELIYQILITEYRRVKALALYNKIRTYKLFTWWD